MTGIQQSKKGCPSSFSGFRTMQGTENHATNEVRTEEDGLLRPFGQKRTDCKLLKARGLNAKKRKRGRGDYKEKGDEPLFSRPLY